jgi:murein DD-endopeptidase MepM/ murein hydrolase activator NlpD
MRFARNFFVCAVIAVFLAAACVQPAPDSRPWMLDPAATAPQSLEPQSPKVVLPTQRPDGSPYLTPTPDSPHSIPAVQVSGALASDFKIIPDSELVYGPVSSTLDVDALIQQWGGYLSHHSEYVEEKGMTLTGAEIVKQVSYEYSVNPRLLLALLEYQSGWATQKDISEKLQTYPMKLIDDTRQGLYIQLSWAANQLNYGYYSWKAGAISSAQLQDGTAVTFSSSLNAGTVAVQRVLGLLKAGDGWSKSVSADGLYATFVSLFGIPFDLAIEPLIPSGLTQPTMQLPFEKGDTWSFTGGPHSAWGNGAAWAALDFAPPSDVFGCFTTNVWEVAVADGLIVRSENGEVVLDLDGDGLEQTGWTVLYMHVETRDRISVGTRVKAGDRIGHPSCEGGYSTATHLHLARRYNGEWISADGNLPFVLDGWTSQGSGVEYNGYLVKGKKSIVAEDGIINENQIKR